MRLQCLLDQRAAEAALLGSGDCWTAALFPIQNELAPAVCLQFPIYGKVPVRGGQGAILAGVCCKLVQNESQMHRRLRVEHEAWARKRDAAIISTAVHDLLMHKLLDLGALQFGLGEQVMGASE